MNSSKTSFLKRRFIFLLSGILLFAFLIRVYNLSYPPTYYFDEVYHAFTARQYLQGNPDAYNIWAKPPEGVAYEWTHPPLAKLIIAASMKVFGENSFGWRISSVVFGIGVIAISALLALEVFGSPSVALISAYLLSVEGLVFAQSRIAMNDVHFLFFLLLALLLYIRWKKHPEKSFALLCAGVSFGLSLASKWTAVYALGALGVDQLVSWISAKRFPSWKPLLKLGIAFSIIPAVVYLMSYGQFFALGYPWKDFVELQKQMWYYHTHLKATHAYQSRPWQWALDLRPVWYYVNYAAPNRVGNIYNLGNPVILYAGLVAVAVMGYRLVKRWKSIVVIIPLMYVFLWIPWFFSPRIMFFYHYTPAVPFLSIMLAVMLSDWMKKRSWKYAAYGVLALSMVWFVVFYPNLTGFPVPTWFANAVYFAVPSWK